jgi:hypothetical protein
MTGGEVRGQSKDLIILVLVLFSSAACHAVREPVSKIEIADVTTTNQLLSGFWLLESNSWRWTARKFSVALQPPDGAETRGAILSLHLYIPDSQIELLGPMTLQAATEGESLDPEIYTKGGSYTYTRELSKELMTTSVLPIKFVLDKALPADKSDGRELGVIVTGIELQTK